MLVTQMSFISIYLLLPSSHKGIASEFPSLREGIGVGSYFLPQGGGQEGALREVRRGLSVSPSFGGGRGGSHLHPSAPPLHRSYILDYQAVCKVGADVQIFLKN